MKQFPSIQTDDRNVSLIQDFLTGAVNPLLALPLSNSNFLQGIHLTTGLNTINHGLGRTLQGWIISRLDANVTIYDDQDSNSMPTKTLDLIASGACTVSLNVF